MTAKQDLIDRLEEIMGEKLFPEALILIETMREEDCQTALDLEQRRLAAELLREQNHDT